MIPHTLEPGLYWTGIVTQNEEIEQMADNGYLYLGVHDSVREKPCLARVKISRDQGSASDGDN